MSEMGSHRIPEWEGHRIRDRDPGPINPSPTPQPPFSRLKRLLHCPHGAEEGAPWLGEEEGRHQNQEEEEPLESGSLKGEDSREGLIACHYRLESQKSQEEDRKRYDVPGRAQYPGGSRRDLQPEPADRPHHPLGGAERARIQAVEVPPIEKGGEEKPGQQHVEGKTGSGIGKEAREDGGDLGQGDGGVFPEAQDHEAGDLGPLSEAAAHGAPEPMPHQSHGEEGQHRDLQEPELEGHPGPGESNVESFAGYPDHRGPDALHDGVGGDRGAGNGNHRSTVVLDLIVAAPGQGPSSPMEPSSCPWR